MSSAIRTSLPRRLALVAALLMLPFGARAAEIDLSNGNPGDPVPYQLLANTPNQTISIYVSGGEAVNGVNLSVLTGDGGADLGGPIQNAPYITAVNLAVSDMTGDSVFKNNNNGEVSNAVSVQSPNPTSSQFWLDTVQTQSGTVNLGTSTTTRLLATITFDTTGFGGGLYALSLDFSGEPTNFPYGTSGQSYGPGTGLTVIDGLLEIGGQVAPEPASIGLLGIGFIGLMLRRRRWNRSSQEMDLGTSPH